MDAGVFQLSKNALPVKFTPLQISRTIFGTEPDRIGGNSSRQQITGWDSNPRRRITKAESWPLEDR